MERLSCPIDVQIELTETCNQWCIHCYNYWRYNSRKPIRGEMNKQGFLTVLDTLQDCGVSVVTLTGGEPLLRPKIFFALLQKAKNYGMEVGLNSNGILIGKNEAERMYALGLDHALISLLGLENTHDFITNLPQGFKKTREGISNLVDSGISVAVNMVASRLNQKQIYAVGGVVKELGVKTFCVTPMVPSHPSHSQYLLSGEECKKALRELLRVKENLGLNVDTLEPIARCLFKEDEEKDFIYFFGNRICSAAVSSCVVSPKGNIRPCIHADKEFGSILKEGLSVIWRKMISWSSADMLPKECAGCNANFICEGGCRMSAKLTSGKYNGEDMYMTEPIMDMDRISKLPKNHPPDVNINTPLKINPKIFSRKEKFGWIVYIGNNVEFCTENGFTFILKLKEKGLFTKEGIVKDFGYGMEQTSLIINKLLRTQIVLAVE